MHMVLPDPRRILIPTTTVPYSVGDTTIKLDKHQSGSRKHTVLWRNVPPPPPKGIPWFWVVVYHNQKLFDINKSFFF